MAKEKPKCIGLRNPEYRSDILRIAQEIEQFKLENGVQQIIAVIGGSDENIEAAVLDHLSQIILRINRKKKSAILCGGTRGGLPEAAANVATELSIPSIGVYPENAKKNALDNLDLAIEVPAPIYGNVIWGSETPVLAGLCDIAIIVGGSTGTIIEIATLMKHRKAREKLGKPPIYLVSLSYTGGAAALAPELARMTNHPLLSLSQPE